MKEYKRKDGMLSAAERKSILSKMHKLLSTHKNALLRK